MSTTLKDQWDAKHEAEQKATAEAVAFFGPSYHRRFKVKSLCDRPACPWCDRKYGSRHTTEQTELFAIGQAIAPYRGNLLLVEEILVAANGMGPGRVPGARLTRIFWDGETYYGSGGAKPFCTAKCAIAFAKAAHKAGYRRAKAQS